MMADWEAIKKAVTQAAIETAKVSVVAITELSHEGKRPATGARHGTMEQK